MKSLNWRKPVVYSLLYLSGSKTPKYLEEIRSLEKLSRKDFVLYRDEELKKLLSHAYRNVPYYHKVLKEVGVINNQGKVVLKNFNKIPILTKEIIRKEKKNLYSRDYKSRKSFLNHSGGSTGEPVEILQDKNYKDFGLANTIYYNSRFGKDVGEKELKLWGSERDILGNGFGLRTNILNFLYNRKLLNSFRMDPKNMSKYIKDFNVFKPKHVWAYVDSIYELARFAKKNNLYVYSPNSIAVTAGVLTKDAKDCIEEVFRTSVYNQYGSREVGDVAVENIYEEGMQIFEWNNYFEFNEEKKVRVTNLHNYSMPIIRYDIGDTYVPMEGIFKNGIKTSKLKNINGRITGHFRLKNGVIVPAQFFIHFVGVVFNDGGIQKFQIIQNTYEHITIKYVSSKENLYNLKENVEKSIRKVMGRKLIVTWQKVKDIPRSKSGKYLYTISKVSNEN